MLVSLLAAASLGQPERSARVSASLSDGNPNAIATISDHALRAARTQGAARGSAVANPDAAVSVHAREDRSGVACLHCARFSRSQRPATCPAPTRCSPTHGRNPCDVARATIPRPPATRDDDRHVSFLELERLEKTWPDGTRAVRGVDLTLEDGEFVVLLGPSGCGKTTTLRMIAGLEQPTNGRVRLAGRDVTELRPSQRDIGFVFQFFALYPHMSVAENIGFPLECAGVPRAERDATLRRLAEHLDLTELLPRRPRELSGGDQQRVALARAMARRPALWLMDEPLGQLDTALRGEMCEYLRAQQLEHGAATVYVTHDQEEAMRLADRVVVMDAGEILQAAAPQEVYDDPATLFVARFVGSPGMNLLEGTLRSDAEGSSFLARGSSQAIALGRRVQDGPAVLGIRPERLRAAAVGPLGGRVVLDAFAGACRYQHIETPFGRIVLRAAAESRIDVGCEIRLAFDRSALRLFDAASGRRIA